MEWDPWKVRMYMVLFFIVPITVLPAQLLIYGLGSHAAEVDTTAVFGIWQWEIASCSGEEEDQLSKLPYVQNLSYQNLFSQLCKILAIKTFFASFAGSQDWYFSCPHAGLVSCVSC